MKNAVLVLLLMLLPLQSVFAAERHLTHVLSSGDGMAFVLHHMADHAAHVLHHHDDGGDAGDGATHIDKSEKSVQHLADFEQGATMAILLPAVTTPGLPVIDGVVPFWPPDAFSNRTTSPLLRPPRAFA